MGVLTKAARRGTGKFLLITALLVQTNKGLVLAKRVTDSLGDGANQTDSCASTGCHRQDRGSGQAKATFGLALDLKAENGVSINTISKQRSLARRIEIGDEVCGDGRIGLIPNQSIGQGLDVDDRDSSDWGDLDLPSVLETNKFNSDTYYRDVAFGDLASADLIFKNDNDFFLVPLAEGGTFVDGRKLQRSGERLLGLAYANWNCETATLTMLIHAIPGLFFNPSSIENFVQADKTKIFPTDQEEFIRDSDNSPVGFEIQLQIPCDSCLDLEISAAIDDMIASSGKLPQIDLALPCCVVPSGSPSSAPSNVPSELPSQRPSMQPSTLPSISSVPSKMPSGAPSEYPSSDPSAKPSQQPSFSASPSGTPPPPTDYPTVTAKPSVTPTTSPSTIPSVAATETPTIFPTRDFLQVCSPWQAPEFYPYRVEKWTGREIQASEQDQCCPEKTMRYMSMYGDNPFDDGSTNARISIAADRSYTLYINGVEIGSGRDWQHSQTFIVRLIAGDVIAVEALDNGDISGLVVEINFNDGGQLYTSKGWKVSPTKSYGWNTRNFDDSSWSQAVGYGRVNDSQPWRSYGYTNGLSKKSLAEWIWLQRNPTRAAYFRYAIPSELSVGGYITMTGDKEFDLFLNGELLGSGKDWQKANKFAASFKKGDAIAVRCRKGSQIGGLAAEISFNSGELLFSSNAWKASSGLETGWSKPTFDDSLWNNAVEYGVVNMAQPWTSFGEVEGFHVGTQTSWIWTQSADDSEVFFRFVIPEILPKGSEIVVAADNFYTMYLNGRVIGQGNNWQEADVYTMSLFEDDVVGLKVENDVGRGGIVAEIKLLNGEKQLSSGSWKATSTSFDGWNTRGFDSYDWPKVLDLGPITAYPWNNRVQGLIGTQAHWIWVRSKEGEDRPDDNGVAYMRIVPYPGSYPVDGNKQCDTWTFDGDDSYLRNDGNLLNTAAYTGAYSQKINPLYDPLDDAVCFNEGYKVRNYNLNEMMSLYQKYQRAFDRELSDFSDYTEEYNRITHNRIPGMMLRMCFHDNSVHSYEPKFQDYVATNVEGESGRWNGPFKYLETSGGDASNLICPEERHHPNNE